MVFNQFWANAISIQEATGKLTHFAMLHDDIVPESGWLDILMEDLLLSGAVMVSAVVPIKDPLGLSSTAIDNPKDPFQVERRLSMHEIEKLPLVFGSGDCGYPDRLLLANTGCWVCDLTHPMFHERNSDGSLKIHFTINDQVKWIDGGMFTLHYENGTVAEPYVYESHDKASKRIQDLGKPDWNIREHGRYTVRVDPEDWQFSRKIGQAGGKVLCTKRVSLSHMGIFSYPNRGDWGEWQYDKTFEKNCNGKPILLNNTEHNEETGEVLSLPEGGEDFSEFDLMPVSLAKE